MTHFFPPARSSPWCCFPPHFSSCVSLSPSDSADLSVTVETCRQVVNELSNSLRKTLQVYSKVNFSGRSRGKDGGMKEEGKYFKKESEKSKLETG